MSNRYKGSFIHYLESQFVQQKCNSRRVEIARVYGLCNRLEKYLHKLEALDKNLNSMGVRYQKYLNKIINFQIELAYKGRANIAEQMGDEVNSQIYNWEQFSLARKLLSRDTQFLSVALSELMKATAVDKSYTIRSLLARMSGYLKQTEYLLQLHTSRLHSSLKQLLRGHDHILLAEKNILKR